MRAYELDAALGLAMKASRSARAVVVLLAARQPLPFDDDIAAALCADVLSTDCTPGELCREERRRERERELYTCAAYLLCVATRAQYRHRSRVYVYIYIYSAKLATLLSAFLYAYGVPSLSLSLFLWVTEVLEGVDFLDSA